MHWLTKISLIGLVLGGCGSVTPATLPPAPPPASTAPPPAAPTLLAATASASLPFEVVAQGEVLTGADEQPVVFAVRGSDPLPAATLAPEVLQALEAARRESPAALYLVISPGRQRSTGFRVQIDSISAVDQGAGLQVVYTLARPEGGGAVLAYPYSIVRVAAANVEASQVQFTQQ